MATNLPPHHLGETIDAIVAMIDKPDIDVEGLMKHIKGPDFPTGAFIVGRAGIRDAYRTGRGRIVMRARAHIEELRGGKSAIVISELPYGVKKGGDTGVIRKIADLVHDKVLTEISDLADHSDRTGMRIQIELKRDAVPQVALNKLFKHTPLQSTFGYNAVALVDGVPRTLSLLEQISHYLDFQREVVTRRLQDELKKAEARAHVLEGYLIALDNIDAIVALIRGADDTDDARTQLMSKFALSEIQAQAILDMRLARLTGLARKEVETEHKDLTERIAELRATARRPGEDRRPHPRGAAGDQADLRQERRPPHRDRARGGGARARGHDRGRGHGDRDHAVRLHQAATRDRVPRAAPRRHRRDGHGAEGRGLHRAPVRRLDARLHPLLHERRQGVPAEGARAAARLAPVEGPRDREPAAVPAGRAGARRRADARLLRGEVRRVRNEERRRQEDGARRVQHAAEGRRDHRDQDARGRRARRRPPLVGRRRHPHGLEARPGDPLQREGGARDGPRRLRRAGNASAGRRRGDLDQHRAGRLGSPRRDRERIRQAHAHRRLPAQGTRRHGREDDPAQRGEGHARRRAHRARRLPGDADLDGRHRDQDAGRRRQAARPRHAGRDRHAAPGRRDRLLARTGGRLGR